MATQLALGVTLSDAATFENFVAGDNQEIVAHLRQALSQAPEQGIYFWGPAAVGKTHLLQAVCHAVARRQQPALYLPLAQLEDLQPDMLEGLEGLAVVCIDDLDRIAGRRDWQEALFHLYNRMQSTAALFIASGSAPPNGLSLTLADLQSRLAWGGVFQLQELSDEDKQQVLQLRAARRGLELPADVAQYCLRRYRRDLVALIELLERLDTASLAAQRKLTIPFVREVIERCEE